MKMYKKVMAAALAGVMTVSMSATARLYPQSHK